MEKQHRISPEVPVDSEKRVFYTADRTYYAQPADNGATVVIEKERTRWNWCFSIALIIFLLFVVIAIVILVYFFTRGYVPDERQIVISSEEPGRYRAFAAPGGHYDLLQPDYASYTIGNGPTCLFAVGDKGAFDKGHAKGAQFVAEQNVIVRTADRNRQLAHPLKFQDYIRNLGGQEGCHVLLYPQQSENLGFARATWFWWVFKTFGYPKVSVLNGGYPAYTGEKTNKTASPVRGNFSASWDPNTFILYDDLQARITEARTFGGLEGLDSERGFQIIDARSEGLYNGSTNWVSDKRGHIPYAVNVPSTLMYQGMSLNEIEDIRKALSDRNVKTDTLTVIYSETMLEASVVYFVLSSIPEYGPLRIYDGGWEEYAAKTPEIDLEH